MKLIKVLFIMGFAMIFMQCGTQNPQKSKNSAEQKSKTEQEEKLQNQEDQKQQQQEKEEVQRLNPLEDPKFGPDSAARRECLENLVYMNDRYKEENWEKAMRGLRYTTKNCPKARKNIYIRGANILQELIEEHQGKEKEQYRDTLMNLYDQRIKHFGEKAKVLGYKGYYMLRYGGDAQKAYDLLKKSIKMKENESPGFVVVTFMNVSTKLNEAGVLTNKKTIADFNRCLDIFNTKIKNASTEKQKEEAQENRGKIETIFTNSDAISCDALVNTYKPKFKENPDDVDLLKKISSLLEEIECTESTKFYVTVSEKLYEKEPSADAAYQLAKLLLKKENYKKSLKYYKEAIDNSEDSTDIGKYAHQAGLINLTDKIDDPYAAAKMGEKAMNYRPEWSKSYLLLAKAYSSIDNCPSFKKDINKKEKKIFYNKTIYWAAFDMLNEALPLAENEEVKSQIKQLRSNFKSQFPQTSDAFFVGFQEGDSYEIECLKQNGLPGYTTTIRTVD